MNCKPGDLAVVTGLPGEYAVNNGHIVEVLFLERWGVWNAKCVSAMKGKNRASDSFEEVKPGEIFLCMDEYLRPIGGVPVTDDVDIEVPA